VAQQLVNAIALGSVYTLFALGLSLSWGILNVLNLAHGAIFMFGAMAAYLITERAADLPLVVVLPLAALVCAGIAALLELLAFGPIRRRSRDEHDVELRTLIASIAAASMLVAMGDMITNHETISLPDGLFEVNRYEILGLNITNIQILLLVVSLVLSGALMWFIRSTRNGKALRAVAFDRQTTGLLGVSASRLGLQAIAVSGALAGVAGVLLAIYLDAAEARMGETLLLKAFVVIILAGVGSLGGAVVFAFGLAIVETLVQYYLSADLRDAVAFGLIIAVLLIRPQGLTSRGAVQRA
jgi:branched-chain amino acid transport system permease protein